MEQQAAGAQQGLPRIVRLVQMVRQGDRTEGGKEAHLLLQQQMRNLKFTKVQSCTWIFQVANSGVGAGLTSLPVIFPPCPTVFST